MVTHIIEASLLIEPFNIFNTFIVWCLCLILYIIINNIVYYYAIQFNYISISSNISI